MLNLLIKLIALNILLKTNILQQIAPDNPYIQYKGRISFANPKAPSFSMPSTSIKIKFKGTLLKGTFSGKNFQGDGNSYLMVIIDGQANPNWRQILTIKRGTRTYIIANGLSDKEHIVELVKLNEYWGMVIFHGFITDAKEALRLPTKPKRLIEYYGDSNASAWSSWNDKDRGKDSESDGYFSYPAFVGRALKAEIINFSAGGHGMTPKTGVLDLTRYFDKVHIKTDASTTNKWDFKNNYLKKKPDVVVINLGANDYYKGAKKEDFFRGWEKMVYRQIRPVYPKSHIVLVNSEGWAVGEPSDYLEEILQRFNAAGERNISFVKFPWLWGEAHAVLAEHATFASFLAEHIAKKMNWEIDNNADYKQYELVTSTKGNMLANASFEKSILLRPDGWRPVNLEVDAYAVFNKKQAYNGVAYLECPSEAKVQQTIKANQNSAFSIQVWIKGNGAGQMGYAFINQGQTTLFEKITDVKLSERWQRYRLITTEAPLKTWKLRVIIGASSKSFAKFDDVRVLRID